MFRRHLLLTACATACVAMLGSSPARAADDVVIGAIYPMSGNGAQVGADAKAAMETAVDLINGQHAKLPMLLGDGNGLPKLGGAHIRLVFADSQGDPQKARTEAERLITQEHVVAIVGSYNSSTSATISQVAERYELPFLVADSTSPSLSQRGLKWFFRTTPHDEMFNQAIFSFLQDAGKLGHPITTASLFYEDSVFGTDSSNIQRKLAQQDGIKIAADVKYRANSPSLSGEVGQLKSADADVLLPSSYTSDAILLMRTMHEMGYKPKALVAQAAGFQDPAFITGAGPLAEGVMSRSSYAGDAGKERPAIGAVQAAYTARAHKDLNDNSAREFTGVQVIADAINRAGSTKPEAIRDALVKTDIPGKELIMPWKGVKFDSTGQNTEGTPVIQQIRGGTWHTVWPADLATEKPTWSVGQ